MAAVAVAVAVGYCWAQQLHAH
ncbi:hypothetical protein CCACVL1_13109 [Corchorus capsularis]|uniref:Uncharacterized protein n=1 Tax=Corchorus capsularis TaxID=210143 RepID=A0A1R3IC80_COCAP|nr:hypothetical protein CCACVL1_13109 [Corchorus capsularis]